MHINQEQIDRFGKKGFVLIENAIPADVLQTWQELAVNHEKGVRAGIVNNSGMVCSQQNQSVILRQNEIISVFTEELLKLLALPALLEIASKLSGPGTVPIASDLVYKRSGRESQIIWHQDAPHSRRFPYLNIGIYLDDSDLGDGCLRFVPGSQEKLQPIGDLARKYGWDFPGFVDCPAKAGDIVVHDMMILHCSQMKITDQTRRTLYVEMRPFEAILDQGMQSVEWASLRQRWMAMVGRRVADPLKYPDLFENLPMNLDTEEMEVQRIMNLRQPAIPAAYYREPLAYHSHY